MYKNFDRAGPDVEEMNDPDLGSSYFFPVGGQL